MKGIQIKIRFLLCRIKNANILDSGSKFEPQTWIVNGSLTLRQTANNVQKTPVLFDRVCVGKIKVFLLKLSRKS